MKYRCKIYPDGTKICKKIEDTSSSSPQEPETTKEKEGENKEDKKIEKVGSVRRVIIEFEDAKDEEEE